MRIEAISPQNPASVTPVTWQNTLEKASFAGCDLLIINSVTPVTPDVGVKVTKILLNINDVTPVTPVTPVLCKIENMVCVDLAGAGEEKAVLHKTAKLAHERRKND